MPFDSLAALSKVPAESLQWLFGSREEKSAHASLSPLHLALAAPLHAAFHNVTCRLLFIPNSSFMSDTGTTYVLGFVSYPTYATFLPPDCPPSVTSKGTRFSMELNPSHGYRAIIVATLLSNGAWMVTKYCVSQKGVLSTAKAYLEGNPIQNYSSSLSYSSTDSCSNTVDLSAESVEESRGEILPSWGLNMSRHCLHCSLRDVGCTCPASVSLTSHMDDEDVAPTNSWDSFRDYFGASNSPDTSTLLTLQTTNQNGAVLIRIPAITVRDTYGAQALGPREVNEMLAEFIGSTSYGRGAIHRNLSGKTSKEEQCLELTWSDASRNKETDSKSVVMDNNANLPELNFHDEDFTADKALHVEIRKEAPNMTRVNNSTRQAQISRAKNAKGDGIQKQRIGTAPRPKKIPCKECTKMFSQVGHLRDHVQIVHRKEKPFRCTQCNYSSGLKSNLTRHTRIVHERP